MDGKQGGNENRIVKSQRNAAVDDVPPDDPFPLLLAIKIIQGRP
jgi:hypothetical protein